MHGEGPVPLPVNECQPEARKRRPEGSQAEEECLLNDGGDVRFAIDNCQPNDAKAVCW